ncbi:dolichyl-phosphate beta-D-mannosyltransferase [Candidatus Beckwithbacteria bacterium CG10_big_fil_rev_8_21_14_0_10_34_10]|uniref:Dolichyl-phosphate beta-D-mannosyltransferase n=1 Tax=Candidatus Beckwithbacteria bacterium CG10_big_fil_rev_8_21_14_0_10_34_10 TaxID=1974495 RepID=A0A2H0WBW1_9BACT|nr:MAG: dolichyl-phosphate beta-D-mannosyltransferase [Candidatus Beckwithbacteria bacterium CG10_big_fil_rev_8_21_14_0_10_34_10]
MKKGKYSQGLTKKYIFKNIWLFLPCHNEEENLEPLVRKILGLKVSHLHIVIINDASLDKTSKIADALAGKYKNVKVVHRQPPRGRALAGKDGFRFCLNKKADVIIEMDADFSHQPKYIPQFLRELEKGESDVILGSRFIKGGSDANRDPFRTFVSKLSGVFLRLVLGIKLKDMGSGYKVYKGNVLEKIKVNQFFSKKGLAISMESIFRVLKAGFKVKEMPIVFVDRRAGKSKLSWKDFFEPILIAFKLVIRLGRFSS